MGAKPSVVNGDPNALGEGSVLDPSTGDLGEGEASASRLSVVMLDRARPNDGAEELHGPGEDLPGPSPSVLESSLLAAGLVEPGADADALPVLPEMHVREDVVMSDHVI